MSYLFFVFLPSEIIVVLPEICVVVISPVFSNVLVWLLTNQASLLMGVSKSSLNKAK